MSKIQPDDRKNTMITRYGIFRAIKTIYSTLVFNLAGCNGNFATI